MKIGIIAAMEQELVLLVEQLENKVEETVLAIPTSHRTLGETRRRFGAIRCR
ncbi:MAG: hypothetical protein ACLS36_09615 [Streptococcus sp.]